MSFKFYLSGGMEYKKGLGKGWRENLTEKLVEMGHSVFDPVVEELGDSEAREFDWKIQKLAPDLTQYRDMVRRKMFRKDMRGIQLSHAVILLYDESVQRGAGSLAEAWEAFREGRPLYVITQFRREEVPGWLVGESTALFRTANELLDYLASPVQVKQDIKEAKLARDLCLGEVYDKRR